MALVEREEVLASLEDLLADAVTGRGKIAIVSGAVASGKTALLNTLVEDALEHGALALTASCSQSETGLALAVLSQILHNAPLTPDEEERTRNLLHEGARCAMSADPLADHVDQVDAHIVHALCMVLLELAERHPLMIVVDDVQHADRASLLCLAYLARRLRFAHILAIFSQSEETWNAPTLFQTELLRQPHCRRFQLSPLSREGVEIMTSDVVGDGLARRLASDWHAASGGNPLLVNALLEDHTAAARPDQEPDEIAVGDGYRQAVLSCLRRAHPRLSRVARGLAVLGEPDFLDRLLDLEAGFVVQALHSLQVAGLVGTDLRFRHEEARAAVLADLDVPDRVDLHRRAAEIAYGQGAAASVVAEHLLTASHNGGPWAVSVLEEAARQALSEGRVEPAVDYLRLADRACTDDQRRATIKTTLVRAEWRLNPSAPAAHLDALTDAMHKGHLRGSDAVVLAKALLWHGRFDDARDVLDHIGRIGSIMDAETVAEIRAARPWLRCSYTPFLAHIPRVTDVSIQSPPSSAVIGRLEAATALAGVLTKGPRPETLADVERILRSSRLDDMSMDAVECALLALIYAERPDKAAPWCDLFIEEAGTRRAPSRQARLAALRAEISLRQGDLEGAESLAQMALRLIPASSWGVAVGGPLSVLLSAVVAMGRLDEAVQVVGHPVPESMLQTRYGLHYLNARGRYHLATGDHVMALRDFQTCGELMGSWSLDSPGLVSWRTGAAEALVALGRPERARPLLEEHLAKATPGPSRSRGIGTRLMAAASEPRQRPPLLRRAADMLQASGDQYELARALVDLADAYQAVGELRRARTVARQAQRIAEECEAVPLVRALSPDEQAEPAQPARTTAEAGAALSEAERRVAALAAVGYTNREIADKLYITVSTVEQHLTRIYRKLNVTRRSDLPAGLEFSVSG
ncbi:LuxR family transcriptional regulator [Microbispora corallina]|uniref:Transcriptional regulator n=1 Tax=Microbispora corallina TaxID=83302 RepID=A0ABQ4G1T3_9ACTN|nr:MULTISPECIES: LuxR family transcriptional regulator [Microbispora]ETK35445.1 ATPase [Microbispora sp. ATCC PTA-5024]GIH41029.1 transcriptional regulator [Microbispora corallina]